MDILLDLKGKNRYNEMYLLELELQSKIIESWDICFPNYIFIKNEFKLTGDVRHVNKNGRIDILALNRITNRFVIIEIKKIFDVNIRSQAFDYLDYFMEHKHEMYLKASEYKKLPPIRSLDTTDVEIILIAKQFKNSDVNLAKNDSNLLLTIISYSFFHNNQLFLSISEKEPRIPKSKNVVFSNDAIAGFWDIFNTLHKDLIIKKNVDFKILHFLDGITLYINIPSIYEKYALMCKQRDILNLDINNLRVILKSKPYCKGIIKSTIIGKKNSSAFMFDLNMMKDIIEL